MNFRRFVENPVKVTMFFLALALLGGLSYRRLPLNLFPDLQTPRVTLVVEVTGLSPDETEKRLTLDFERQLTSIKGVANVTSFSRDRNIVLHVDFHWGQDMEFAYLDVMKNVGALATHERVENVEVYRFDPNAAALMTLAFVPASVAGTGEERDEPGKPQGVDRVRLTSLVENSLKPKLETIKGVAYVKANGASRREVTVLVNDDIMAQLDLTAEKVIQAVQNSNINSTGGVIIEGNQQMSLKFVSRFRSVDDIRRCLITIIDGHPIRLEDLGEMRVQPSKDEIIVRQDGVETVSLDIFREPDANAVQTARRVRKVVAALNKRGDFGLKIAADRSLEVEAAINEVVRTAGIGMLLAMGVLLVFLRNIFATIVATAAIPLSIVAAFSIMYFQGLSLNIMTLGGLALAAGMLVDNAIVVIENIFQHRQGGLAPMEAAEAGVREVGMAITAATLTTIVVFVPLVYVHGIAGILFKDQALTVVYSLLISLLVALILIPMLAARISPGRAGAPGAFNRSYGAFLAASMRVRWFLPLVFIALMAFTWFQFRRIPTRFFPESVNGQLAVQFAMPLGATLEQTERAARRLEAPLLAIRYRDAHLAPLLRAYETWQVSGDDTRFLIEGAAALADLKEKRPGHPATARLTELFVPDEWKGRLGELYRNAETTVDREQTVKRIADHLDRFIVIQSVTTTVGVEPNSVQAAGERIFGPHTGRMEVVINPRLLREISAEDVIRILREQAETMPGLTCGFESRDQFLQDILGKSRGDIVIEVHAEKLDALRRAALQAAERIRAVPGLANVRTNLILGEEAYILEPDRDAMLRGRYEAAELGAQIDAYLRGDRSDWVKLTEGEMGIVVKSPRAEREGLQGLMDLQIVSREGGREKLGNLVNLHTEREVREIMRVNQERTLLVMADLDGIGYQDAVAAVRVALDAMQWERATGWGMSGEEVKRRESFAKLFFALVIGIVLVYMVIASILESIVHPLTIMFSVPLALTGVVTAFLLTGISLNLMGYIGIVMLTGIVVNNAIVLFDRIGQLRRGGAMDSKEPGLPAFDAVVQAGRQRLRPIIMTSLTTILALTPLAMGFGNGAELRKPMAIAVIGGLSSATLLTLWILPALYLCVEDCLAALRRLPGFRRAKQAPSPK